VRDRRPRIRCRRAAGVHAKAIDVVSRRVGNHQYSPQWGILLDQLWAR